LTLEWTLGFTFWAMTAKPLTIGKLAALAAVTPDTLRYYERVGLVPTPMRTDGGYRLYDPALAERIGFIRKAQALGLSLEDVREVLRLADAGTAPCEHVRAALGRRLRDVEVRIAELESLRQALTSALRRSRSRPLARSCVCEIIESRKPPRRNQTGAVTRRRGPLSHARSHQKEES
jgi:DNA-binding transcriptional MerR regulator